MLSPNFCEILLSSHIFPYFRRCAAGAHAIELPAGGPNEIGKVDSVDIGNPEFLRPTAVGSEGVLGGLTAVESHTEFVNQGRRDGIGIGDHRVRLIDRKRNRVPVEQLPGQLIGPPVAIRRVVGLGVARENRVVRVELVIELDVEPRPVGAVSRGCDQVLMRPELIDESWSRVRRCERIV